MTEHQRGEPMGTPFQDPDGGPWRTAAEQAIETELFENEIEIAVYVKGRMIRTKTDAATVARIMAILTGMGA